MMSKKAVIALVAGILLVVSVIVLILDEAGPAGVRPEPGSASGLAAGASADAPPPGGSAKPLEVAPFTGETEPARGAGSAPGAPGQEVARLVGRLCDEQSRPLAGARVELELVPLPAAATSLTPFDPKAWTATTADDGAFAIDSVPVGALARVRARPQRFCDVVREVEIHRPGLIDLGTLVAATGGSLAGTVLATDRQPCGGAVVTAIPRASQPGGLARLPLFLREQDGDFRTAEVDPTGAWRIDGLEPGTYAVTTQAPEHAPAARSGLVVTRGEVHDAVHLVLSRGRELEGSVMDDAGRPIANATVSIAPSVVMIGDGGLSQPGPMTKRTPADGSFRFDGLRDEPYDVTASRTGFVTVTQSGRSPGSPVELVLQPCGVILGQIRRRTDEQVPERFEVSLRSWNAFLPAPEGAGRVLVGTAAAAELGIDPVPGLYAVLDVPAGGVRLEIRAPGHAEEVLGPFDVEPGQRLVADAWLEPEATLAGTVLGPDGQPCAGATVAVQLPTADREMRVAGATPGRRIRRGAGEPSFTFAPPGVSRSTTTDDRGAFELGGLAAGSYHVLARHRDHAPSPSTTVEVGKGARVDGIVLELSAGGRLVGRTFDDQGSPLPGVRVRLRSEGQPIPELSAASDPEGRYELRGIPPGPWIASIERPHRTPSMSLVFDPVATTLAEGEVLVVIEAGATAEADLSLPPRTLVFGTVREAGLPASGVKVVLETEGMILPFQAPSAITGADGRFQFDDAPLGRVTLVAWSEGAPVPTRRELEVVTVGEQRADIDLPTGLIQGRVIEAGSGRPLAGVTVTAADPRPRAPSPGTGAVMIALPAGSGGGSPPRAFNLSGAPSKPVVTDEQGRYRLRHLPEDTYTVSIKGAGIIPQERAGVTVAAGQTTANVDFEASFGATLVIHVDTRGEEVPYCLVKLLRDGKTARSRHGDPKVPFEIDGLEPGTYRVEVETMAERFAGSAEAIVPASGQVSVPVTLRPL